MTDSDRHQISDHPVYNVHWCWHIACHFWHCWFICFSLGTSLRL